MGKVAILLEVSKAHVWFPMTHRILGTGLDVLLAYPHRQRDGLHLFPQTVLLVFPLRS